jgi:hypothetical protein
VLSRRTKQQGPICPHLLAAPPPARAAFDTHGWMWATCRHKGQLRGGKEDMLGSSADASLCSLCHCTVISSPIGSWPRFVDQATLATVNWLLKVLGIRATPASEGAQKNAVVERDAVVAALVERCGRLTAGEAAALAGAWAAIEDDAGVLSAISEGRSQAGPDAVAAADDADWAFRRTLGIPSDGAIYAPTHPIEGRAINAITAHAVAIAGRDRITPAFAAIMSGPWHAALGVEPVQPPIAQSGAPDT